MAKKKIKFKLKDFETIERDVVKNDEIVSEPIDDKTQKRILEQVNEEYEACFSYNEAKRKKNLQRLKLYNNQRRDTSAVGDPLMFTVFNTVHAELYDDRLLAKWQGKEPGDDEVESNLNALSKHDYKVMMKSKIDYQWNWDAEFFGRGLLLMMDFERKEGIMAPVPEVIDAATFIRDSRATSVNGDNLRGKGAMRYGGRELGATYYELKALPGYFNIGKLRKDKEINSTIDDARQARRDAQDLENYTGKEESLSKYNNYEFRILDWFTTFKGEKYLVTLGNSRGILVRMVKIEDTRWPIIDRALYPMANDWDGVSIPDITEDKQRGRAVLLNIGMKSAKDDVSPNYLFDQTRIKNKNDLNTRVKKFIPVDGNTSGAMEPVQKATAHQFVGAIMEMLDTSAQKATAATDLKQGSASNGAATLGEQELATIAGNKRFNMSAKVYGWSEADFWRQWYWLYKKHFKNEIDEKIARIQGALAPSWRTLTRDSIIARIDPDVEIESFNVAETTRINKLRGFTSFIGLALQDPEANKRFLEKQLAKLNGMTPEEIDLAFPPTVDEMQAEEENDLLNSEKIAPIGIRDNHVVHIGIHSRANQNKYSITHIRAHKKLMIIKRNKADLFPPEEKQPIKTQPEGKVDNVSREVEVQSAS